MWAQLKAAAVEQENQVSLMQIDMMQLQVLQTQMDNIMLQSTLVVGFAIGLWGGETLAELVKDTEEICIWKTTASLAFGHLYFYNVAVSISCGVIIVICVSYLKQASQQAALTVNTGAAIAMTRHHLWTATALFVTSIITFVIAAVLLVVLYVGIARRIPYTDPRRAEGGVEAEDVEGLVTLFDGKETITCINPQDPSANDSRDVHGKTIAIVNTCIIGMFFLLGAAYFKAVRQSYQPATLLRWYVAHQARVVAIHERLSAFDVPLGTGPALQGIGPSLHDAHAGHKGGGRGQQHGLAVVDVGIEEDSVSEG